MQPLVSVTVLCGAMAAWASILALRDARRLKHNDGHAAVAITLFWASVASYMVSFTLLRIAYSMGLSDGFLVWLFYLQTLTGASTVISLASIMFGVFLDAEGRRFATATFLVLASINVTLIFALGIHKTVADPWGVEFLPASLAARIMVALVYMLMPLTMAAMVTGASKYMPADVRRRFLLFSLSVVLMYIPNAVKYVVTFEGAINAVLAAIMMLGAFFGWRAYARQEPAATAGNG